MTTFVTTADAVRALETVVEKAGPDYMYDPSRGCLYFRDDQPSCGVGRALHELGVPTEVLAEMDEVPFATGIKMPRVQELLQKNGFRLTERAVEALVIFQRYQDGRVPWGQCLGHVHNWMTGYDPQIFSDD